MPGIWLISALYFLAGCYWGWWVFIAVPFYVLLVFSLLRKNVFWVLLLVTFSCILWGSVGVFVHNKLPTSVFEVLRPHTYFVVTGVVRDIDLGDKRKLYLQAERITISGKKFSFPYRLCIFSPDRAGWAERLVGSRVSISIYFSGKRFYFLPKDGINMSPNKLGWIYIVPYYVRKSLYSLMRFLSAEAQAMLGSALLGIKDDIYFRIRDLFNKIGVGHILAISGLHLMILSSILFLLLRALNVNYHICLCVVSFFIAGYVMMIPESPSLLRAGLMYELWILSRFLGRNWSLYDILGLTVLLVFLIDPVQVFSIGFILSFVAVLSIVLGFSFLKRHSIIDIWWVGIFASLGLAPIIIKFFGCFPLISWVVAPFFVVCLTLLLVLGCVYLISLGFLMRGLIDLLVKFMLSAAKWLSVNPLSICLNNVGMLAICFYYLCLLAVVLFMGLHEIKKGEVRSWI